MTKKNVIGLCVALAIMVIIAVLLIVLLTGKQADYEKENSDPELLIVNEIDQSSVVKMSFTWGGNDNRNFIKKDGKWYLSDDPSSSVDQTSVRSALNFLSYMYAKSVVAEDITKLNKVDYELDVPRLSALLKTEDGKTIRYDFGCLTSAKDGIYLSTNTDNRLYLFSLENYDYIVKGANAISDLTIDIDEQNIVEMEFEKSTGERVPVHMEKTDAGLWRINSPFGGYADEYFMSQLMGLFNPCSFHRQIADNDDGSYGFSDNGGYIYLKDASGKQIKLIFGKIANEQNDRYYCKIEGESAVYETFGGWSNVLKIDMQNVLMSNPLSMSFDGLSSISIALENEYLIEKLENGYALNGKELASDDVQKAFNAIDQVTKKGIANEDKNIGKQIGSISFIAGNQTKAKYALYEYMKDYAALSIDGGKTVSSYVALNDLKELEDVFKTL